MNYIFLVGLTGALTLVLGSAWPEEKGKPVHSTKNWFFALGAVFMLGYAVLNYIFGTGSVFFILLESLVIVATIMMMLNLKDTIDAIVLSAASLIFIIWSIFLYQGLNTIVFIIGLTLISLGYAFKTGSMQRFLTLTLGSLMVAIFSYVGGDMVFFWLNTFFALFSGYYLIKAVKENKK